MYQPPVIFATRNYSLGRENYEGRLMEEKEGHETLYEQKKIKEKSNS